MSEKTNYFVLKEKAVPEVLLKVVEAKRLFESGKAASVQDATDAVGISRSSFYKYKDFLPQQQKNREMERNDNSSAINLATWSKVVIFAPLNKKTTN